MSTLTRETFLNLRFDLPTELVELPGGTTVHVRTLTAAERDRFEAEHQARKDRHAQFRARFAAAVLCDCDGKPLFTAADVETLDQLPGTVLDAVVKAGMALNGLGEDATEAARKNS